MFRGPASKWVKTIAVSGIVPVMVGLMLAARFRIWTYSDYLAYKEVSRYPIGDDLWLGRIRAGQPLAGLINAHPPHNTREVGPFTVLSYYTVWPAPPGAIPMEAMIVIAKDGRLVQAARLGCCWNRDFFAMEPADAAAFHMALENDYCERRVALMAAEPAPSPERAGGK
jgi:hypothetical protein